MRPAESLLYCFIVFIAAASSVRAQSYWALEENQSLRYELEVRQTSKPVRRLIVDLTWTVREVNSSGFRIRATVDRVRVDLKGGASGFEIDTARETQEGDKARAALIQRSDAKHIPSVVGAAYTMVLSPDGTTGGYGGFTCLSPLSVGLPGGNLRALLETGIEFPEGSADEWEFFAIEKQSDGSQRRVSRFKGKVTRKDGNRLFLVYQAEPRKSVFSIPVLWEGRRRGYTRTGTAEFDLSRGYLIKSRERFSIKGKGRFTVTWRFLGEGRLKPPEAQPVPVLVVSRLNGEPIPSARIHLGKQTVTADRKGRANLPSHEHCFRVSAPRFVTMEFTLPRPESGHEPPHTLKLCPAASLRGRFTDPTGSPLPGAPVSVRSRGTAAIRDRVESGVEAEFLEIDHWDTQTGKDGCFRINGLPTGVPLELNVRPWGLPALRQRDLELEPGETRELSLECPPYGTICGRVTDADKKPVAGVRVRLSQVRFENAGLSWSRKKDETDDTGSYRFDAVPVGRWSLRVTRDGEPKDLFKTVVEIRKHGDVVVLKPVTLPRPESDPVRK